MISVSINCESIVKKQKSRFPVADRPQEICFFYHCYLFFKILSSFSTTISGDMFFMQAKSPRIHGLLP